MDHSSKVNENNPLNRKIRRMVQTATNYGDAEYDGESCVCVQGALSVKEK